MEKKHGKGKEFIYEYFKGEIIFEGVYLNGEKWNGKEKEYDLEGNLLSERCILNG